MVVLARYIYVIYFVISLIVVIIFIKPKRIKELLPVSVLSALILFLIEFTLIKLEVYRFNNPIVSVAGVPLFLLLWGAISGMVVMQLMKKEFLLKLIIIILLTLSVLGLEAISEYIGAASHLGKFNNVIEAYFDFLTIVLLVWISEGLWRDRIYKQESINWFIYLHSVSPQKSTNKSS